MMPSKLAGTSADGGPDLMAATARDGMVDLVGVVMIGRNEGERLVLGLPPNLRLPHLRLPNHHHD